MTNSTPNMTLNEILAQYITLATYKYNTALKSAGFKLDQEALLKDAKSEIKKLFLELIGEEKQGEYRQIASTYGKVGCLVIHYSKDLTKSERDHGYNQAIQELRKKIEEL